MAGDPYRSLGLKQLRCEVVAELRIPTFCVSMINNRLAVAYANVPLDKPRIIETDR